MKKVGNMEIRLKDMIGSGSFGKVYRAMNLDTKEVLAVKIVNVDTRSVYILSSQRKLEIEEWFDF